MCGRYRRTTSEEELARLYHIPIPSQTDLPISYNIAPSQKVLTIRFNPQTQQRSLDSLQWGLIPYWAKDPKIAYRTINARAETVDKAPSFRQAFIKRRCLKLNLESAWIKSPRIGRSLRVRPRSSVRSEINGSHTS